MQNVSRHSSYNRRNTNRPLVQPISGFVGQRAAFAAAGLPSISRESFAVPYQARVTRPAAAAAPRPVRRAAPEPMSSTRIALSLGAGSTCGMLLGGLLCSLFAT